VIVILGILAATALPKFIDLRSDAQEAAFQGVKGAAASAMAINYAGCSAVNNVVTTNKCVKITDCSQVGTIMQGGLPSSPAVYSVASVALATPGFSATCTLALAGYTPTGGATFTGIGAGL